MSPIESALIVAALAFVFRLIVLRQLDRLSDPAYLRSEGVVIVRESAIEAHSEPIGEYRGHPIWGSVTFKGMRYRFDHVIDGRLRERIAPGELFLEPGLVYALK